MSKQIIKVIVPVKGIQFLHYFSQEKLEKLSVIIVPFRKKQVYAIYHCLEKNFQEKYKLRQIVSVLSKDYVIGKNFMSFIEKTAQYYGVQIGCVLQFVFPGSVCSEAFEKSVKKKESQKDKNDQNDDNIAIGKTDLKSLSQEQLSAFKNVLAKLELKKAVVLHGVTGSGKTEVYFHVVEKFLKKKQQVLLMVPEIGLSNQLKEQFEKRFGFKAIMWHSKVSASCKKSSFDAILSGKAKVVIGVRSAIFLPYKNLGCIVVDEEHDVSFKHESYFYYNARDLAVLRGHEEEASVILASATPSLETMNNVLLKKYSYVGLKNRFFSNDMPEVKLINMIGKGGKGLFITDELKEKIQAALKDKQKVLLFLNKRGYAPIMVCTGCGFKISCPHCSITLVWHKKIDKMICSYCDIVLEVPRECEKCGNNDWTPCGPGVERVQENIAVNFPLARTIIVSKDTMKSQKAVASILNSINSDKVDIIIGTQIITKGYNFAKLSVVGVLDADFALLGADLRAKERTFQVLSQVGGRSGREGQKSSVSIQTYFAQSKFMQNLVRYDFISFIKQELAERRQSDLPPYKKACKILVAAKKHDKALIVAKSLVKQIYTFNLFKVLGPSEARTLKVKQEYRIKILILDDDVHKIHKAIQNSSKTLKIPSSVKIKIDIDPYDFD